MSVRTMQYRPGTSWSPSVDSRNWDPRNGASCHKGTEEYIMNMVSMENVISGGAIGISLTGMAIVFSGLVLISLMITYLPRILDTLDRFFGEKQLEETPPQQVISEEEQEERDIASVIGLVMQMEHERMLAELPVNEEEQEIASVIGLVLQLEAERQETQNIVPEKKLAA